ncbi:RNA-binding protein of the pumilio family [Thalassiosira pseudonana CCMP1335]|uniref:RNA-binding protein of the pumilio family n=1 Tax=Thalassiosira pseudonana TaxID=35128 RepID=B5YP90_THAPS|nr:RNA-binding protein of the pumilio family [Thalassiosira pseudonana CCMP1335]ACI64759.1 RNA-binding protein of the pumilio family [Thalassiosira pseudonana CCMP1335]
MAAKSSTDTKSKPNHNKGKFDSKKRKFDNSKPYPKKDSNSNSAATPSNKKRALKAERQSHRKHATTVRTAKEIWNELRIKTNTSDQNSKLATELYGLFEGKMMEVAMQHDASRMVQAVIQFGNKNERGETVRELCGVSGGAVQKEESKGHGTVNLAELCKIQYAHFVVLKMIKYCARDEDSVKLIVKSLRKQMTKLAVHSVGSRVVELLFATFPSKATAPLKLELYGPQYALFATSNPTPTDGKSKSSISPTLPTLASFIETNPDKLESTLTHLQTLLQKGLDKHLTGFAYFHSLLFDYVSIASPNDIRDFLTPALAEHSLHLISTRAGTKVVCECAAYGSVKDRKKMLKCFKGYTRSSLLHRDAYLAILRMVDVMDDTVLVNKMLLAELHQNSDPKAAASGGEEDEEEEKPSPILDLVLSDTGSKMFLLLLVSKDEEVTSSDEEKSSSKWQKYLDPYEIEVLHRNPTVTDNGESVPTSKKEDETRRQELVVYLKELLVDACVKHTEELMRSKAGSKVLIEACESFPSEELYNAVLEVCADSMENDSMDEEGGKALPILEDPVGHLTLKHLFLAEARNDSAGVDEDDTSLARMFYDKFQSNLGDIASTNRGAFVLSALIAVPSVKEDVKKTLKGHTKEITQQAKKGGNDGKKLAGCSVLLEALKKK